ncbi:MAG TPA: LLM class F420-dependent oxidoreductase [Acidimicrobiales bacterium]|nr:LLM class F420-dependent oxidoreductase [Acidimicrobiales bacterium]
MDLGPVGVWWSGSWRAPEGASAEVAAEMEALGYGALWCSGGFEPGLASRFQRLLAATTHLVVASGIVSIWAGGVDAVARDFEQLDARHPGRFLLGLGASHAAFVEDYRRPYSKMVAYLDDLDATGAVPRERRALAALGPRMLRLAAERAAGAHPYFVPVEHTARARRLLGREALLAPEVTVVLERDPARAREQARRFTTGYLGLPNYADNLRSLGFTEEDVRGGGSDRLVDAVVAWGDPDAVVARVKAHHEAGADHVCVQVVAPDTTSFPLAQYRALAPALLAR